MFSFDTKYMTRCIQLAAYGAGRVASNPMVGAVIVYKDEIIGEGYHRCYGEAHAEPNAINSVKNPDLLKDCTLYVSLEPCSHHGKTPPCADLIISKGIPRVVVGTLDPNPKVAGNGIRKMQEAGIEVVSGVLEKECLELNKRFFTAMTKKRPYITLKWAETKNGFIDLKRNNADTSALKLSNELTSTLVHKQRAENQAILIGTNTSLLDNPTLTTRNWPGKNPIRIVLDRSGKIPTDYHLLDGSTRTIVFTEKAQANSKNVEYIAVDFENEALLDNILNRLYELNIYSVLVEGGAALLHSFINKDLWDEATVEQAHIKTGNGVKAPVIPFLPVGTRTYRQNTCFFYKNNR